MTDEEIRKLATHLAASAIANTPSGASICFDVIACLAHVQSMGYQLDEGTAVAVGQAVELVTKARSKPAASTIDARELAKALVTEVMGDGNLRVRWAMITTAANEAAKAGARELASCMIPGTDQDRWALIKLALVDAVTAGARELGKAMKS